MIFNTVTFIMSRWVALSFIGKCLLMSSGELTNFQRGVRYTANRYCVLSSGTGSRLTKNVSLSE